MILADTSAWIDHFRASNPVFAAYLREGRILTHPFVIGELAVGNLRRRERTLRDLRRLLRTRVATDQEVLRLIELRGLYGIGVGFVDCHLLASALLTPGVSFLTRDKRLRDVAASLGLATDQRDVINDGSV